MRDLMRAIVADIGKSLALKQQEDAARPIGEQAIDIDHYEPKRARRQYNNYQGDKIQWSAVLVKWTGKRFQRVRRLTGPLSFESALNECARFCRQRGLKRV